MVCPIHVWAPLAAAAAPFALVARERLSALTSKRRRSYTPPPPPVQRWAPVAPAARTEPVESRKPEEQPTSR